MNIVSVGEMFAYRNNSFLSTKKGFITPKRGGAGYGLGEDSMLVLLLNVTDANVPFFGMEDVYKFTRNAKNATIKEMALYIIKEVYF